MHVQRAVHGETFGAGQPFVPQRLAGLAFPVVAVEPPPQDRAALGVEVQENILKNVTMEDIIKLKILELSQNIKLIPNVLLV